MGGSHCGTLGIYVLCEWEACISNSAYQQDLTGSADINLIISTKYYSRGTVPLSFVIPDSAERKKRGKQLIGQMA